MRFWDTSAVVPLLAVEIGTTAVRHLIEHDPAMVVWWGTRVECHSALARYARNAGMTAFDLARARKRLAMVSDHWLEIVPSELIRTTAERLLRTHSLRAAAALQLSAALAACDGVPTSLAIVSLDVRQREAAHGEGFDVFPDLLPGSSRVMERAPGRKGQTAHVTHERKAAARTSC